MKNMGQKPREKLFYTVRQVLLSHWDPIGVHEFRMGDDEYDTYIPKIISSLETGVENEEIAKYLSQIRTESINLPPDPERDAYAARLLQDAYEKHQTSLLADIERPKPGISNEELAFEAARFSLGLVTVEQMQSIINSIMEMGTYHDAFYDVLYPDNSVTEIVSAAFEKSLQAMDIPIPDYEDSVWVIIRYYLMKIVNGGVDPYEGLRKLMYEVYWKYDFHTKTEHYLGDSHGIEMLIELFWSYDDIIERSTEVSLNGKFGDEAIAELKKEIYSVAQKWFSQFIFDPS